MSKHYLLQKQNGIIIKKTVKDWAREPHNQKKFPKYSFQRPYNTDTTPTSEEIDAQLQREGCKREIFNGDNFCYVPGEISENDLILGQYKRQSSNNIIVKTNKKTEPKIENSIKQIDIKLNTNIEFDPIENIKQFIDNNSVSLFKTLLNKPLSAIFDDKGFFFSDETQKAILQARTGYFLSFFPKNHYFLFSLFIQINLLHFWSALNIS